MQVVIAPDGFGGTLSAPEAAAAIAAGWREVRAHDRIVELPMSDGGEGLLEVVATPSDTWHQREVAGPHGHPLQAPFLVRADGSAVIESARACGLHLLPPEARTPRRATTFGVGQLLRAAMELGADPIRLGLGGTASIDAGTGALIALGFRLRVADGSGLKVGGEQLAQLASIERGWAVDRHVGIELLADVTTPLRHAAERFGPQKGADAPEIEELAHALRNVAEVAERDLGVDPAMAAQPGSGAAGGLGYGLAVAFGARLVPGAATVAELIGLPDAIAAADLVVTGEGRLDATTGEGKVVAVVRDLAQRSGRGVHAVVGQQAEPLEGLATVVAASPEGPGEDPAGAVASAAARLAATVVDG
ncbi:MAG: glycerate kinase [Nitriliruptoraceae bacterium]